MPLVMLQRSSATRLLVAGIVKPANFRYASDVSKPDAERIVVGDVSDQQGDAAVDELHAFMAAAAAERVAAATERSQLRMQIAGLTTRCEELVGQMQELETQARNPHEGEVSCSNLMQVAAARGEEVTREKFRPTLDMVRNQPTHLSQLDNEFIAALSMPTSHAAHKERLLREIMQIDNLSWEKAHNKLWQMDKFNERYYWIQSLPYRIGIIGSGIGAVGAVLLVFHKPIAELYGTQIASEELPEGVDTIDQMTTNQVGTWTWAWMEPMIGTASFVLLCCQFGRAQCLKLGTKPYTEAMQRWRADRLAKKFPQYDRSIVRAWAKPLPMVRMNLLPVYKRDLGYRG